MPQVPPVLHEEAALEPKEYEPPPLTFEANVDIFFLIFGLPQAGQATVSTAAALRTSSSKGWLHSVQMNSNRGMVISK
jgi:hypothetical protein